MKHRPGSSPWGREFVGRVFDKEKAREEGWRLQGEGEARCGVPRNRDVWLIRLEAVERPWSLLYWFVLMVELEPDGTIRRVADEIHQVFNDGHEEIIDIPLFPPEDRSAQATLRRVVVATPEAKRKRGVKA